MEFVSPDTAHIAVPVTRVGHSQTDSMTQLRSGTWLQPGKGETVGLRQAQRDVRGLIRSRVPFDSIEDRINSIPGLDDHERAALWLYAWSRQGRGWQRATADQLLEWAGGSP